MSVSITIDGANEIVIALDQLDSRATNLAPALNESALFMERETKLNFARQAAPDKTPWAKLKPSTLREKRGGGILVRTGALSGSIAAQPATANQVTVKSSGIKYGIFHQFGTRRMVARPFMGFAPRHIPMIKKIVERHLRSALQ